MKKRRIITDGFKKLSAEQTELFDKVKNGEIVLPTNRTDENSHAINLSSKELYDLLRTYDSIEAFKDEDGNDIKGTREYQMRQVIADMDNLSYSTKSMLDSLLIAQSKQKDKEGNPIIRAAPGDAYKLWDKTQRNPMLYAYSMYGDTDLEHVEGAVDAGLTWSNAVSIYESIKGMENTYPSGSDEGAYYLSAAQNKALEIMQMDRLSTEQKQAAAKLIGTKKAEEWDFTSEDTLMQTMLLTEDQRETLAEHPLDAVSLEDLYDTAIELNYQWYNYLDAIGGSDNTELSTNAFKRLALYGASAFNNDEKKEIGKVLFNDPDNLTYADKDAFTAFAVSESCGNKYAASKYYGLSVDQFTAGWGVFWEAKDRDAALYEIGFTSSEVSAFKKIAYMSKDDAVKFSLDDSGEVALNGYISSGSTARRYRRRSRSRYRRRSSGRRRKRGSSSKKKPHVYTAAHRAFLNAAFGGYSMNDIGEDYAPSDLIPTISTFK